MLDKLRNKLKVAVNFPSPPAVAQQIIDLASDPDIDVVKVATAMSRDPGLTAKVLRIANSPLYSKQRKSENLRQALVVLGLNAATTLALSFSLVGFLDQRSQRAISTSSPSRWMEPSAHCSRQLPLQLVTRPLALQSPL